VIKRTGRARDDYPPHVKESWRWAARLVRWVLWTYPRRRRRSIEVTVAARSEQLTVIRLQSTSEIEAFAASLGSRRERRLGPLRQTNVHQDSRLKD